MIDYINHDLIRTMMPQLRVYDEIIAPFTSQGYSFVYFRLFAEDHYYILAGGGPTFLNGFVQLKKANIFCKREFTGYADQGHRFLEWPDVPSNECMYQYYNNAQWYGVTVLKQYDNYLEACAITCDLANNRQEVLSRSKNFIMASRQYVISNVLARLNLPERFSRQGLFRFIEGCSLYIDSSKVDAENQVLAGIYKEIVKPNVLYTKDGSVILSSREAEVLFYLRRGFSAKDIARELKSSPGTVRMQLESIRTKTGTHCISDILKLAQNQPVNIGSSRF